MKNVPEEQVLGLIIAQLKHYSYFSIAKKLAEQIGINPDQSNQLAELCGIADYTKQEDQETKIDLQEEDLYGSLVYDGISKNARFPNVNVRFSTQHRESCRTAAFSPDGNLIVTGSQDTSLKVIDVQAVKKPSLDATEEKKVIKALYDHTAAVNEVCFHPNGTVLASCSDDNNIKFYDLQKQNSKRGFRYLPDSYPVRSISFHPSGEFIISGTDHHAVRLFDIHTMKAFIPTSPSEHHLGPITKVRYAPNGSMFASSSIDGTVKLYDTVTGKCINTIQKAHGGASVTGIQFSKSSQYLLSTGLDSNGKLWDMNSGKLLCTYEGPQQVYDQAQMVFAFNEETIIGTDATNQSIVVWETQTGKYR
jgi:cleavage stimulation factor subunit 1